MTVFERDGHLYSLGRRTPQHDPKSLAFSAPRVTARKTTQHTVYGPILNQGDTSACTGYGTLQALNTGVLKPPARRCYTGSDALGLYHDATVLDPFEGQFPPDDNGSTVLAACQAAKAKGIVTGYTWAFGIDHVLDALCLAPVVVGTTWTDNMFDVPANGVLDCSGASVGGHCYALIGIDVEAKQVVIRNSWGIGWGLKGRARIRWADLARLLKGDGEAAVLQIPAA